MLYFQFAPVLYLGEKTVVVLWATISSFPDLKFSALAGRVRHQRNPANWEQIIMAWNDERVELLKKLWAEGLSASQIASKMGGVTRNAVIGKVHRLGLSGRAAPAKPQRGMDYKDQPVAEKTVAATPLTKPVYDSYLSEPDFVAPIVLSGGDMATVSTLSRNMCKWPIGDPASDDFHFCGQSTPTGKSYCPYHAHMAFQPSGRRPDVISPQKQLAAREKRRAAG